MNRSEQDRPPVTPSEKETGVLEAYFLRRRRIIQYIAGVALVSGLAACAETTDDAPVQLATRQAPHSAPYSRDANPQFYADITAARGYVPSEKQEALDDLSRQAVAEWLPENTDDAVAAVKVALVRSSADKTIPVFVSYAIPNRDLGGHSAGGLAEEEYGAYVKAVSTAIGQKDAIMVVEPDALAQIPDMHDDERAERISLLAKALDDFSANANTAVYLDAGNSRWRSTAQTAGLLRDVKSEMKGDIAGISLNVSNYQTDSDSRRYAKEIMGAYGTELYVLIDDSRNGTTDTLKTNDWCNPEDQTLGTADPLFDAAAQFEAAYIKTPGESDGNGDNCGPDSKPAGEFDGDLLIRQLRG